MADTLGTIKEAYSLAKDLLELRDATVRARKIGELQTLILQAQEQALASNEERSMLVRKVSELEAEIARSNTWEAEKQRYKLEEMPPGVLVYALKPEAANGEPPHRICEVCYNRGKKSLLHADAPSCGQTVLRCHGCNAKFTTGYFRAPNINRGRGGSEPGSWIGG